MTEYVLDVLQPFGPDSRCVTIERMHVRIRRVEPDWEVIWEGEARELARQFAEWHGEEHGELDRQGKPC